jgi:hypothetical protein
LSEIKQSLQIRGNKKIRVDALIDTGANANFLKEEIANKIFVPEYLKIQKKTLLDIYFTNTKKIKGYQVDCAIQVMNEMRPISFIVVDENFGDGIDVIIGVTFLQYNDGFLDFSNDKMRFRKMTRRKGYWI